MSKKWAKSTNGPDWTDVEAAIRAIDGIHLGLTMVTISPQGTGSTGGLRIAISTNWEVLPGSPQIDMVVTERAWRGEALEPLAAFVLGGLYAHDFAIGEAYQQRSFDG